MEIFNCFNPTEQTSIKLAMPLTHPNWLIYNKKEFSNKKVTVDRIRQRRISERSILHGVSKNPFRSKNQRWIIVQLMVIWVVKVSREEHKSRIIR